MLEAQSTQTSNTTIRYYRVITPQLQVALHGHNHLHYTAQLAPLHELCHCSISSGMTRFIGNNKGKREIIWQKNGRI